MRRAVVTSAEVSARMKAVRQKHTAPEVAVRRVLWSLGLRYRTCVRALPGAPDIANRTAHWAVFVHGCFWHGHPGCKRATVPKTNQSFWVPKLAANRARDKRKARLLRASGYHVVTVWECEVVDAETLAKRLRRELVNS